jgi:hypothetical protein
MNLFVQMAQGVDDETWAHHLHNSDTPAGRESVKDHAIAGEGAAIEKAKDLAKPKAGPASSKRSKDTTLTPALESTLQSVEIALSTMKRFSGEILTV